MSRPDTLATPPTGRPLIDLDAGRPLSYGYRTFEATVAEAQPVVLPDRWRSVRSPLRYTALDFDCPPPPAGCGARRGELCWDMRGEHRQNTMRPHTARRTVLMWSPTRTVRYLVCGVPGPAAGREVGAILQEAGVGDTLW